MATDRKKSWREIDQQRDKSRHRDDAKKGGAKGREKEASASYKNDLDALFTSGGKVPERFQKLMGDLEPEEGSEEAEWRAAVAELRGVEGFREFAAAVTKFRRAGNRLPDDEDLLIKILDHPSERIVADTLAHILDLHKRRGFERTAPLKNRLQAMRSIAEDARTIELLDQVAQIL